MNKIKLMKLLPLTCLSLSLISTFALKNRPVSAQTVNFICAEDVNNIPTTYAETPDGGVAVFQWTSTYFKPPYTPQQRCEEVTQRLNLFQPDYLVSGRVNNYNVICAGESCNNDGSNLLLTLKPFQDPNQVLAEIDANRDGAAGPSQQLINGTTINNTKKKVTALTKKSDGYFTLNLNQYYTQAKKVPLSFSGESSGTNDNTNTNSNTNNNNSPIIPETSPAPKPSSSQRGRMW
jgi:hypothetical protein